MIIRILIGSVSCSFTLKCCQLTEDVSCKCMHAATRVCHCNGEWGQVHCRPSLQLVQELVWISSDALSHCLTFCVSPQLQASLAEETLIVLSQLLPNATNITQRLDLLMRAVREQVNSTLGITETFVQVQL